MSICGLKIKKLILKNVMDSSGQLCIGVSYRVVIVRNSFNVNNKIIGVC